MHLKSKKLGVIILSLLMFGGCVSVKHKPRRARANEYKLFMKKSLPAISGTIYSTTAAEVKLKKFMILGSTNIDADPSFMRANNALIEKVFLAKGLSIISPAITGRVVLTSPNEIEQKNEAAIGLSQLERALLLGKNAEVDAIINLERFGWGPKNIFSRYFILNNKEDESFKEVDIDEYEKSNNAKVIYTSPYFQIKAKLINVNNGEILSTINLLLPANYALPDDYEVEFIVRGKTTIIKRGTESFKYKKDYWEQRKKKVLFPWLPSVKSNVEIKALENLIEDLKKNTASHSQPAQ